jgi:hypothetical protein
MDMPGGPHRQAVTLRSTAGVLGMLVAVVAFLACPDAACAAPPERADSEADSSGGAPAEFTPIPFDSATAGRYRETAILLARAIATGDREAFRALHSDAGWEQTDDWWKAMLVDQKKRFGAVVRVVGLLRGAIRMGGTGLGLPRDGAAILLRFKGEAGASMSFVLDAAGKIERSSLWVATELAQADTGGVAVLWPAPVKTGRK